MHLLELFATIIVCPHRVKHVDKRTDQMFEHSGQNAGVVLNKGL